MIITDDKTELPDLQAGSSTLSSSSTVDEDSPPEYTPNLTQSTSQVSELPPPLPPADIKPTNFLSLSRCGGSIKGTWLIEPGLSIPDSLLPPLRKDEERKNVELVSSYGSVNADLWLAPRPPEGEDTAARVTMRFVSECGNVRVKLHRADDQPVSIIAVAQFGTTTIHLPRSFCGTATTATAFGSTRASDAVAAQTNVFSEAGGVRRAFIGDFHVIGDFHGCGWTGDQAGWHGDEVFAESMCGNVRLVFVDEEESCGTDYLVKIAGIWARISTALGRPLPTAATRSEIRPPLGRLLSPPALLGRASRRLPRGG